MTGAISHDAFSTTSLERMTDRTSAERVESLIRKLTDIEKENLWLSTGINIDIWSLDKERAALHEKHLVEYREAVAVAKREGATWLPNDERCTGCERSGPSVEYLLNLVGPNRICNDCLELLSERASHANDANE